MKNLAVGLLVIAALVFGGLYIHQKHKISNAEIAKAELQKQVGELQSNSDQQQQQTTRLREEVEQARADTAAKNAEAAQMRAALQHKPGNATSREISAAPAENSLMAANPLAELSKSPEMKEMIKNQTKSTLGIMIDKNYARLFSDLHLTSDQTASLKNLILEKQMGATDLGLSLMSGDVDATKRAQLAQQIKTASDAADAQIKQFLGEDNFAQFQSYDKAMPERMSITGFKDQLSGSIASMTDAQEQQLVQAMGDERQRFKFTTDLSDKSQFSGDIASMLNEDKMNGYLQELGQLNQQYLSRAQTILSPEQYGAFEKYLNNQQALQKMGMKMAARMFAPAKPGGN